LKAIATLKSNSLSDEFVDKLWDGKMHSDREGCRKKVNYPATIIVAVS
jgi:hypothetical protein